MTAPRSEVFAPGLLAGTSALVTGGGTGIGRAIALELGRLGADVAIASRSADHLAQTERDLAALGRKTVAVACDIRRPDEVEAMVETVLSRLGKITLLVNNAGGQFRSPAIDYTLKGWNAVIETNLTGTWIVTQRVAQRCLIPQHGGRIVSIVANMWRGFPGLAHTGAARAGVANLTQSLAIEWAEHGILVNAVAPGVIDTEGIRRYGEKVQATAAHFCPMKRLGRPEEVAWAVAYLASPAGDYITGAVVRMDGGASLWGSRWQIPDPTETPARGA